MKKKSNHKVRGPRIAILSEDDRDFLKGKLTRTPSKTCDFYSDLKLRFTALIQDLTLIHDDPNGNIRSIKSSIIFSLRYKPENWISDYSLLKIITHGSYQESYINEFRKFKKKKVSYYWMNVVNEKLVFKENKSNYSIYKKAEKPNYMFRRLGKLKDDQDWLKREGHILLDAYSQIKDLLPIKKEDAMTYDEIKKRLLNPKPYIDWNKENNTMSMSVFKRKFPDDYKEFRKQQRMDTFSKKEEIRIQKKLSQIKEKEKQKSRKKLIKKFNLKSDDLFNSYFT